jgi:DNA-binding protein YbaB
MLEDLVAAAFNDAVRQAEKTSSERLSAVTGGLQIPGMNLPF